MNHHQSSLRIRCVAAVCILVSTLCGWHAANATPAMSALRQGDQLLVAANNGQGIEMCYSFKHCRSNQLMTFSHVGVREVSRTTCEPATILSDINMKWLNSTTSDNIGPVGVSGYNNFVGGTHSWHRPSDDGWPGSGPATDIRTARCDSFVMLADGRPLADNELTPCHRVTVEVWNTIFDPLVQPAEGATILASPLISEHAFYTLIDNSIAVTIEHRYLKSFTVSRYYGMQSNFGYESLIMTPGGAYPTWTARENVYNFTKNAYPAFNKFLEMDDSGWMQSAWMRPEGLGTHGCIATTSLIYEHAHPKSYHVLIDNHPVTSGSVNRWSGVYTWALPMVDNASLLAYTGIVDGQQAMFIDAKKACTNAVVPWPAGRCDIELVNSAGTVSLTPAASGISLTASAGASVVVVLTPKGDINGDNTVDVNDLNAVVNLIVGKSTLYREAADLNGDGRVNVDDLNTVINVMVGKGFNRRTTYSVNGVHFDMIDVPGGTFTMGATDEQGTTDPWPDERPTHEVTLGSFAIGRTEVTQALWQAVMGSNPSARVGADNPVECVSWDECQTFITRLNALTGCQFRMLTEAEWEYAARGGNKSRGRKYAGSDDVGDVAWFASNSGKVPHPVATKAANELGLHDMSGNVGEWCYDYSGYYSSESQTNPTGPATGTNRQWRGGNCKAAPRYCRVSNRMGAAPTTKADYIGLRLAM